jgi:plastocyanin
MLKRLAIAAAILSFSFGCGSSSTSPSNPPTIGGGNGSPVSIVAGASVRTTTAYSPNPISISTGGSVTWMNNDSTVHTSTSDSGAWDSGTIAPGGSFTRTFSTAGTFNYHCSIHPNMVATVTVQ